METEGPEDNVLSTGRLGLKIATAPLLRFGWVEFNKKEEINLFFFSVWRAIFFYSKLPFNYRLISIRHCCRKYSISSINDATQFHKIFFVSFGTVMHFMCPKYFFGEEIYASSD